MPIKNVFASLSFFLALLIGTLSGSAPAHAAEFTETDAYGVITMNDDGSYWAAVLDSLDYDAAVAAAQSFTYKGVGGELATVDSADEQALAAGVARSIQVWIIPGGSYDNYATNQPTAGSYATFMNSNQFWYGGTDTQTVQGYVIRFPVPVDNTPVTASKTFAESDAYGEIAIGGNGHAYATVLETLTWAEAEVAAQEWEYEGVQGHLVTISDVDEDALVKAVSRSTQTWIGLTDHPAYSTSGEWVWIDDLGTVVCLDDSGNYNCTPQNGAYQNWGPNQPAHLGEGYFYAYMNSNQLWYSKQLGDTVQSYTVEFDLPVDNTPVTPTKTFSESDAYGEIAIGGNGHAYATVLETLTWAEAEVAAQEWEYQGVQGHLVTISDVDEDAFVAAVSRATQSWIGLTDHPAYSTSGEWVWIDDLDTVVCLDDSGNYNCTPQNGAYQNWGPNNPAHLGEGHFYAYMNSNQLWYSKPLGGTAQSYTVEFDLPIDDTPVTATTAFTSGDAYSSQIVTGANGHTYAAVLATLTWAEAEAAARDWYYDGVQGQLATISNATEDAEVAQVAPGLQAWIGLTDHPAYSTSGEWVWIDDLGTVVCLDDSGNYNCTPQNGAYQNWGPNNPAHLGEGYFYAYMNNNQLWYSKQLGDTVQSYVVEFPTMATDSCYVGPSGGDSCAATAGCGGQSCNDGNPETTGDQCTEGATTCAGVALIACGDGTIQSDDGETCDDGNRDADDGCSATCQVESGFDCTSEPSVCTTTCGDGIVAGAETCDDDGTSPGDGCSDVCVVESDWACDDADPSDCHEIVCGDGLLDAPEACDDGDTDVGDGCSDTCAVETGWDCASGTCAEVCGDDIVTGAETCDDGGTSNNDGCSDVCQAESGFACAGTCTNEAPRAVTEIMNSADFGLDKPYTPVTDSTGNVYVSSHASNAVLRWDSVTGAVTQIISSANFNFEGPDAPTIDSAGNVYVAGYDSDNVLRWDALTGAVTEIMNHADGGFGLEGPYAVSIDSAGNVYVPGFDSDNVLRWDAVTEAVTEIMTNADFALNGAFGIATDSAGRVYVTGYYSGNVLVWLPIEGGGLVIEIISSDDNIQFGGDENYGPIIDSMGNVYVSGYESDNVLRWDPLTGAVTEIMNSADFGLSEPFAVSIDSAGNVYVPGYDSNNVLRWDALTGAVTEIMSNADFGLTEAYVLATDSAGNVYVPGWVSNNVLRWDAVTGAVTEIMNSADFGLAGAYAVATDSADNVYLSAYDSDNVLRWGSSGVCLIEENNVCASVCGDGLVVAAETCDDNGTAAGDGCSDSCAVESGWACDTAEPSVCHQIVCGDGLVDAPETCDDSGTDNADGCSDACVVESGWNCDGADPTTCNTVCGDSIVVGAEQCDDGGTAGGDCCSATCDFEASASSCGDTGTECIVQDTCDGAGTCVDNGFVAATTSCGDTATECSDQDTCNGSGTCVVNDFPVDTACTADDKTCTRDICNGSGTCTHPAGNAGTECRAQDGACDLAETCTGSDAECPSDALATAGTECRASADATCDPAEQCDGASRQCGTDIWTPDLTTCDDGSELSEDDVCLLGLCCNPDGPDVDDNGIPNECDPSYLSLAIQSARINKTGNKPGGVVIKGTLTSNDPGTVPLMVATAGITAEVVIGSQSHTYTFASSDCRLMPERVLRCMMRESTYSKPKLIIKFEQRRRAPTGNYKVRLIGGLTPEEGTDPQGPLTVTLTLGPAADIALDGTTDQCVGNKRGMTCGPALD